MHLNEDQLIALRKKLSDRGREVNDKILALQSGKTLPPSAIDVPIYEPGEEPEQRLKRFLGIIQGKMKAIRENAPYGQCGGCGTDLPYDLLDREPWRESCWSCA
jgi:hypothetical protein